VNSHNASHKYECKEKTTEIRRLVSEGFARLTVDNGKSSVELVKKTNKDTNPNVIQGDGQLFIIRLHDSLLSEKILNNGKVLNFGSRE
jgi:hypothetical protein